MSKPTEVMRTAKRIRQLLDRVSSSAYAEKLHQRIADRLGGREVTGEEVAEVILEEIDRADDEEHALDRKVLIDRIPLYVQEIVKKRSVQNGAIVGLFVAGAIGAMTRRRSK